MTEQWVVLERTGAQRAGRIIEEHSSSAWTVLWPDGSTSEAKSGMDYVRAPAGGTQHIHATDRARLSQVLREDPAQLALLLLSEQREPLPGTKLRSALGQLADQELSPVEFERLLETLRSLPGVSNVAKKGWTFRGEPPRIEFHDPIPTATDVTDVDGDTGAEATVDTATGRADTPAPAAVEQEGPTGEDDRRERLAETASAATTDLAPTPGPTPTAAPAGDRPSDFPVLERKLRGDTVPRAEYRKWLDSDGALNEVREAATKEGIGRPRAQKAFRDLVTDVLEPATRAIDWETAATLLRPLGDNGSAKASLAVLRALDRSTELPTATEAAARTIASRLGELPWIEAGAEGLRIRLTRRMLDDVAVDVVAALVWRGLTADDLATMGHGRLGAVLASSPTSDAVVKPIAVAAFSEVTSRRRLFALLSGDPLIIDAVGPDLIASALRRVADADSRTAAVIELVSQARELSSLHDKLDAMERERAEALTTLTEQKTQIARLRDESSRLQGILREYDRQQHSITDSERRQLLIDGTRLAAQIASAVSTVQTVEELSGLMERVDALLASADVTAIARRGDIVPFDPTLHDAPGARPADGELVHVGRSGYVLSEGETTMLVRALVASAY